MKVVALFLMLLVLVNCISIGEAAHTETRQNRIYYVDSEVASSGDGSRWETAFRTISEAVEAATQPGDIIEISGGDYYEHTIRTKHAGVTFSGSFVAGHDEEVFIHFEGNGFHVNKDDIALQNVTIIGGDARYRAAVRVSGVDNFTADNVRVYYFYGYGFSFEDASVSFLIRNCRIYDNWGVYSFRVMEGSTGDIQYSIFKGYSGDLQRSLLHTAGPGTDVNLYNCILTGGRGKCINSVSDSSLTIMNSFIGGPGREASRAPAIYASPDSDVYLDHSVVNGWGPDPHNYNVENVGIGENVYQNIFPGFSSWTKGEAIVSITVDDSGNYKHASDLSYVLDGYNLHLTYVPQTHGLAWRWDTLRDMVSRGHDIGSHTRHHARLTQDEALSITYLGQDSDVIAEVTDNGTRFQITTTEGKDNVGPLDLTADSYDTIEELCSYISSLDNYSCSLEMNELPWVWLPEVSSTGLEDGTTDLTYASDNRLNFDKRMPSSGGRYFTDELVGAKMDIESGIGNGYVVKSFAYPYNNIDGTIQAALKDAGYEVARGGAHWSDFINADHLLENIGSIYQASVTIGAKYVRGPDYDDLSDAEKEARVRGFARAFAAYALENGVWASIMIHSEDTFDVTEFGWLVDELIDTGVTIMSMREAIEYIRANWTTTDNVTYTRTYPDSHDYTLQSNSPLVDAGTYVGLTTDIAGNPVDDMPDIGVYEYQTYKANTTLSPFDINKDGIVDIIDIVLVGQQFGKKATVLEPNSSDVNNDGIVDMADIAIVAQRFWKVYSKAAPSRDI